jgi:N-acetylmuramoyl-L-alanine amidase
VQIRSVIALCLGIIGRHAIRPDMVLAHSDVAPGRKVDPGEKFPWAVLARAGVGHLVAPSRRRRGTTLRPGDTGTAVRELKSYLAAYGYGIEVNDDFDAGTEVVIAAFQRHFRPRLINGIADPATVGTLRRLLEGLPAPVRPAAICT